MRSLTSGNTTRRIAAIAAAAIPVLALAAPAFAAPSPSPSPSASASGGYGDGGPAPTTGKTASIEGQMWKDTNGNGLHDKNEKGGLAGVKLILQANDNSYRIIGTTKTDQTGHYVFTGVPATGDSRYGMLYSIVAGAPAGWQWTTHLQTAHASDVVTSAPLTRYARYFPAGAKLGLIDRIPADNKHEQFSGGLVPAAATSGKITGTLFRDTNHDGVHQASEPGFGGAVVLLLRADVDNRYGKAGRTVTDSHGHYTFSGLPASKPGIWGYTVAAALAVPGTAFQPLKGGLSPYDPAGEVMKPWLSTFFPVETTIGVTRSALNIHSGQSVTVNGAVVTRGKPAPAPVKTGTVTGRIWADANDNGVQDKGEHGVKGATALLIHTTADNKHEYLWRTTGADGLYTFAKLTPAVMDHTYDLIIGSPAGGWKLARGSILTDVTHQLDPNLARHFARGAALGTYLATDAHAGQTIRINAGFVPPSGDPNTLPTTGASVQWLAAGGSMAAAGGLALVLLGRRRRTV